MAKTYKTYLPEQDLLLPPSLRDWLPENHLVYCVSDVVDQLDLSAIESVYEEEDRGQPSYHPRTMTKILLYGYCVGVFSSRRIQKRLAEDVAFRVLAADNQPDFRTISDFRKLHLKALEELFQQVLRLVLEVGAPGEELPEELQQRETRIARIPAVSHAGAGESTRRVGTDLHDSQSSEASQDMLRMKRERKTKRRWGVGKDAPEYANQSSGPIISRRALYRIALCGRFRTKDRSQKVNSQTRS